jgi:hypothetical protein
MKVREPLFYVVKGQMVSFPAYFLPIFFEGDTAG